MASVDILIDDARWRSSFKTLRVDVAKAVRMVLKDFDTKGTGISLKFAADDEVEVLNYMYRGKKKPTNVLSFPNDEAPLGDIIFAFETIKAEAKQQGKTLRAHTLHLVIHGTLHLLGYDHEKPKEAKEMEALEIAYLTRIRIANPYEGD